MASKKICWHLLFHKNFFHVYIKISNHTVFVIQFGINLHLTVFYRAEKALAEVARAISAFLKTRRCKFTPN